MSKNGSFGQKNRKNQKFSKLASWKIAIILKRGLRHLSDYAQMKEHEKLYRLTLRDLANLNQPNLESKIL